MRTDTHTYNEAEGEMTLSVCSQKLSRVKDCIFVCDGLANILAYTIVFALYVYCMSTVPMYKHKMVTSWANMALYK
jgi:Fe2+ transport system protein B